MITPLLKLICDYTGLANATLLVGQAKRHANVQETEYDVFAVNYGLTTERCPRDFVSFDNKGFSEKVLGQFAKFMKAGQGEHIPTSRWD